MNMYLAKRILVITAIMGVGVLTISLISPEKLRILTANIRHSGLASIGTVFADSMTADGLLEETGNMEESTSANFWLNSGAYFYETGNISNTIQGDLDKASSWYTDYAKSNPEDTDGGLHPQNIFRLISRSTWDNTEQQVFFKVKKYNLSDSTNRNTSNGLLLMDRYQDDDNLYYSGIRVDGNLVIKKKQNGDYQTVAEEPLFRGEYDGSASLIPEDTWIGIKTRVVTLSPTSVSIILSTDVGQTGTWTEQLSVVDDGMVVTGLPLLGPAHVGIRTDFMDVLFTGYRSEEIATEAAPTIGTLSLTVSVTNDDGGTSTADDFTFTVDDTTMNNGERVDLAPGENSVSFLSDGYTATFSDACALGNFIIVVGETLECSVTLDDVAISSSGSGGGGGGSSGGTTGGGEDSSLDDVLDDTSVSGGTTSVDGVEETPTVITYPSDPPPATLTEKDEKEITLPAVDFGTTISKEELATIIDMLPQTTITAPAGFTFSTLAPEQVLSAISAPVETRSLYYGVRSPEVKVLQAFLATDPEVYPSQYVTGYYGSLTTKAVKAFQKKHGLLSGWELFMPRYGIVGPKTTDKINELYTTASKNEKPLFLFNKTQ